MSEDTSTPPEGYDPRLPYEKGERVDPVAAIENMLPDDDAPVEVEEDNVAEAMEELIAKRNGEDDDGDDAEDEEGDEVEEDDVLAEELKHKVNVGDGEEVEVTLDELKRGYSRLADYTRKTQELAEQRRTVAEERVLNATGREALRNSLSMLESYARLHNIPIAELQQLWNVNERNRAEAAQAQLYTHLAEQNERLVEAIPEWRNRETRKKQSDALRDHAVEHWGFTAQEMASTGDYRLLVLARKAMQWDQAQVNQTKVREQIREKIKPARVLKPGGAGSKPARQSAASESRRARERLRRTGSVSDAASLLERML